MKLTEKDMYYIADGRDSKLRLMFLMKSMVAIFVPFTLLLFLGNYPCKVVAVIWASAGTILLGVEIVRIDNKIEAKAKEMWQDWQSAQVLVSRKEVDSDGLDEDTA